MSLMVDKIFEYLAKDGGWHSLNELMTASHLEKHIVEGIIQFFADYTFIEVDAIENKIKIDPELRKIFYLQCNF